tara:strand:- start:645 stop:968 length:324 start_codon:yes stop_codon:yes gene_type:complete
MGDSVGLTIQDFNDMASRYNALQLEYTVLKKYVKELERDIKSLNRKYQARINKNKSYIDKIVLLSNNYMDTITVLTDTIRIIKDEKLLDERMYNIDIDIQELNLSNF